MHNCWIIGCGCRCSRYLSLLLEFRFNSTGLYARKYVYNKKPPSLFYVRAHRLGACGHFHRLIHPYAGMTAQASNVAFVLAPQAGSNFRLDHVPEEATAHVAAVPIDVPEEATARVAARAEVLPSSGCSTSQSPCCVH